MHRTLRNTVYFCAVVFVCMKAAMAEPTDSVSQFYRSLAAGIKSLKANVLLNVTSGYLKTKVGGQTMLWRVSDETILKATVDYEAGVLKSASVKVSPPVHVWVMGNKGFSAAIDSIEYDPFGNANPHLTLDNVPTFDPNKIEYVKRSLRFGRAPADVLTGKVFQQMGPASKCNSSGSACTGPTPVITEVRLETLNSEVPGFSVVFNENATLRFSSRNPSATTFDNALVLRDGSTVVISQFDYFVDERSVFGVLDNFDLTVNSGVLNTKDLALNLTPGSRLQFSHVQFQKNGSSASIDAQSGQLTATAVRGSRINLQSKGNTSSVVLDDGTQINLLGFGVSVDDQRRTSFVLGGGSNLRVNLVSARFGLGRSDFISLSSGDIVAQLQGTWDSSSTDGASSTFSISSLDAQIDGGEIDVNESSHLKLAAGTVKSDGLEFKSFSLSGLTGTFKSFDAQLREDSNFGLPGSVQVTTAIGATFSAADPNNLLTFEQNEPYPHGRFAVSLPFKRLTDSETPNFSLQNGKADFAITRSRDGSISGQDGTIRGVASLRAGGNTQIFHFDMYHLVVNRPTGQPTSVQGLFKGSIDPGLSMTVTSDPIYHTPGHNDLRIYPITASFKIPAAITIPESSVSFSEGRLNITAAGGGPIVLNPILHVSIPPGRGEHQQPDDRDDTADGTHGPDEDHHRQELLTDTCGPLRIHIYAVATDSDPYVVTANLEFLVQNGVVTLTLSKLTPDRNFAFHKDGCEAAEALGILGAVIGTIFTGPAGGAVLAIVGVAEGSSLDEKVNGLIQGGFATKLYETRKSWRFVL